MTFKNILFFLFTFLSIQSYGQESDKVLFTIGDDEIYVSEFLSVYNKNIDIVKDENQKDINNYLDLFVNYKLKIKQAYDLKLDTIQSYQSELKSYRKQLMEPYLRDHTILEKLVKEAYDRSLLEINASHILVKVNAKSSASDTLKAFNKITDARNKIINGADFVEIAKTYSDDPSVKENDGNLGYFSAFNMVYTFESIAFNTPLNSVSQPFKTRFGYHIIKVYDIRKAKGEIEASHIMIKDDSIESIEKINSIYKQLNDGEDFVFLAKNVSEDTFSAKQEGSLGRFGTGKMVKEFEEVAFSLEKIGDYSKPFKSKFGWHIIRLDATFPIESYDVVKEKLTAKVRRGNRSNFINNSIVHKLKDQYEIKVDELILEQLNTNTYSLNKESLNVLLTVQDENSTIQDFFQFLNNREVTKPLFEAFKDKVVLDYYKNNIDSENKEFGSLYSEYKDGLLLFELMQSRIWEKSKDTLALKNYYTDNLFKYKSDKSIVGTLVVSPDKKTAKLVRKQFGKNKSIEDVKIFVQNIDASSVILKSGIFTENNELLPSEYTLAKGISKIHEVNGKFIFVKSDEIVLARQQEFEKIKGKVISDYQDYLEKEWIQDLRETYTVHINDSVVEAIISKHSKL